MTDDDFNWAEKGVYYRFLGGLFALAGGAALVLEHWLNFGYLEFEPVGHETFGLVAALVGAWLMKDYVQRRIKKDGTT